MNIRNRILFGGVWYTEHWRQRSLCSPILLRQPGLIERDDGRVLIGRDRTRNIVVNQGLTYLLSVGIASGAQVATWYTSTFEGNYTPLAADTAATFPASSTECVAYDEASRPEYVDVLGAQTITNSASRATFTYNATKTIYGASLQSIATKSAVTGTLLAAARFASSRSVIATDVLLVAYTINAASA